MLRNQVFNTPGPGIFYIPDDCNVIFLTGCGAGGGGSGGKASASYGGGSGGAGSPSVFRVPLSVRPGGVLGIFVGYPQAGGAADVTPTYDTTGNINTSKQSGVGGRDLLSPLVDPDMPYFFIGYGGTNGNSAPTLCANPSIKSRTISGTDRILADPGLGDTTWAFYKQYGASNMYCRWPIFGGGDFSGGAGGASAGGTDPSFYTTAYVTGHGIRTFNNQGYGTISASDATYGSGGAGGGCMFGKGGNGGVIGVNGGVGGDATGYGAGGGGGAGNQAGGASTGGLIIIEF